jgi:hypothetical protein
MMSFLKKALNPRMLVPTLLSAALLVVLLNIAHAGDVAVEIARAAPRTALPVCLLTLVYLIIKAVQWSHYLSRLNIRPGWRKLLIPFVGGELGGSLPMGVYLENYLLKGVEEIEIGRSFVATTWILITEIELCLLTLLIVGVPGWSWVRPLAVALLAGMLLVGWLLFRTQVARQLLEQWQPRQRWLQALLGGVRQFIAGGRQLFTWRTFLYGFPLTALYLGAYVVALYIVGRSLIPGFSWQAVITTYAFSLATVLLVSFLPNLGTFEAAGMAVLAQFAVSGDVSLGMLLTVHVLKTGTLGGDPAPAVPQAGAHCQIRIRDDIRGEFIHMARPGEHLVQSECGF